MSNLGLALIAVLVMVTAALMWSPLRQPAAEQAVRSFLEDVHAGDVDAALERIQDAPSGPFLTPEALNAGWEIVKVAQVGYERDGDGARTAQVYAELRAEDGTRLAHRYEVVFEAGEPLIADHLTRGYSDGVLEVNGVMGTAQDVYLLPGVYHFYESVPWGIDMNMPSMLVLGGRLVELGGERTTDQLIDPSPEFTAEGEAAAVEVLREYLDACAVSRYESCPFGRLPESHRFAEADPSEPWRVAEYPTVMPEGWLLEKGLRLETVEGGSVEFDVVPVGSGEGAEPITASCDFRVDYLKLTIDSDTGAFGIATAPVNFASCEWLTR